LEHSAGRAGRVQGRRRAVAAHCGAMNAMRLVPRPTLAVSPARSNISGGHRP
jgi:hypothetical protein